MICFRLLHMLNARKAQEIIEKSGIEEWGAGYFSINHKGDIVCTPKGKETIGISLPEIIQEAKKKGLSTPMIIRFPELIKNQLERMYNSFNSAIKLGAVMPLSLKYLKASSITLPLFLFWIV